MAISSVICFLEIRRRQRLVEGLHSELVLAGLHGRINLVDLVFADQVADRGVRNQDLHGHGAALARRLAAAGFGT